MVGQFTTENRVYDTVFVFRGQDIQQTIADEVFRLENDIPAVAVVEDSVNKS